MSVETLDKFVLVGLPQSGKSTFLAALWHVVESEEVEDSIKLTALPENREYLTELRNRWLNCTPLERNKSEINLPISLKYEHSTSNKKGVFEIPDVAGEMYELQFATRKLEKSFAEKLSSSSGILLFVDPQTLRKPHQISSAQKVQESVQSKTKTKKETKALAQEEIKTPPVANADSQVSGSVTESTNNVNTWKHDEAPAQVILVDLLQIVKQIASRKIKIAVVISAWDIIKNMPNGKHNKLKPEEWLMQETPLLYQFLVSNNDSHDFEVFGVSAQGAVYKDKNEALHKFSKASERLIVQHGSDISHDISAPLKWLI